MGNNRRDAPFEDGFNPRISPDGRYVAAGLGTGNVWDLWTGHSVRLGRGFNCAWLSQTRVAFRSDSQMFGADAPDFYPFLLDQFVGPANWNDACNGVYAVGANGAGRGWLQVNGREVVSGPEVRGAAVDTDGSVIYTEGDNELRRWRNGAISRLTLPVAASAVRVAYGHVAFGYSGPSFVVLPDNRVVDVTVTPNRKEGVPAIFQHDGKIWLATSSDEQWFPGVHIRPLGSLDVFTVSIPATWAFVHPFESTFLVAACDANGRLSVEEVPADTPRRPLVSISKPDPVPPSIEVKLAPPAVTTKIEPPSGPLRDGWRWETFDENNPDIQIELWVEGGNLYQRITHRGGSARTGKKRRVV